MIYYFLRHFPEIKNLYITPPPPPPQWYSKVWYMDSMLSRSHSPRGVSHSTSQLWSYCNFLSFPWKKWGSILVYTRLRALARLKINLHIQKNVDRAQLTHPPPAHFFFLNSIIIKDFSFFFGFPIFYFLSKMVLDPPTHLQFFWMFGFFFTLEHP